MIVRDAARTLEPCLESIRPWVDEIVIVDTGSVDQTLEIAERYQARVFHFPWCDDFSAARNESLRYASGEWIFWMDADDTIDAANGHKLRGLVDQDHHENTLGYVVQVHCPATGEGQDFTAVDHVKLIRNRPDLRFEGRIHEQILSAIRNAGGDTAWTDIFVTHSGSDQSAEGRRKKHERDLRILHLDHQERPEHPFVLFNLGMTYADMEQYEKAVDWLQQSIARAQPPESHLRKAYALLASSLYQLGRKAEAKDVCERGLKVASNDPELLFRKAMLAHEAGSLEEAEAAYRQALKPSVERHFASIDMGIIGAKARHNLACVYADMNRDDLAEIQYRRAVRTKRCTASGPVLIASLIRQRKFTSAELELEWLEQNSLEVWQVLLLRSQLHEAQGSLTKARDLLTEATSRFSDKPDVWEALARFLFERDELDQAVEPLSELVDLEPHNAAAWHNLGIAKLRGGDLPGAQAALRVSLDLRPESNSTREALQEASQVVREQVAI
ncbi:TPR domain-containing glycosyltransferase [Bremerella volcania]|nr:TPR domain-containing glycosyltransferase [Bremerella volcania]